MCRYLCYLSQFIERTIHRVPGESFPKQRKRVVYCLRLLWPRVSPGLYPALAEDPLSLSTLQQGMGVCQDRAHSRVQYHGDVKYTSMRYKHTEMQTAVLASCGRVGLRSIKLLNRLFEIAFNSRKSIVLTVVFVTELEHRFAMYMESAEVVWSVSASEEIYTFSDFLEHRKSGSFGSYTRKCSLELENLV